MDQLTHQFPEQPRPPLILVVDDDNGMRLLLCTILKKEGYTVAEAEDGAQALSTFERLHPDLVLLDAMMPLMDGFATCAALRKMAGGSHIPILMVTALTDAKAVNRAFKAGATDYIIKPVHSTVLRHRISHLLRSKQAKDMLGQVEQK